KEIHQKVDLLLQDPEHKSLSPEDLFALKMVRADALKQMGSNALALAASREVVDFAIAQKAPISDIYDELLTPAIDFGETSMAKDKDAMLLKQLAALYAT